MYEEILKSIEENPSRYDVKLTEEKLNAIESGKYTLDFVGTRTKEVMAGDIECLFICPSPSPYAKVEYNPETGLYSLYKLNKVPTLLERIRDFFCVPRE